jgi:hypothetical protein
MPSREGSIFRPLWRFCHALNKQEVTYWDQPIKKMLINDVRSRKLYENKQNNDKMSDEMSDIYGNLTWILQKSADLEGQFGANSDFGTCSIRKSTATCTPSGRLSAGISDGNALGRTRCLGWVQA